MSVAERWLKEKRLEELERTGDPLPANAEERATRMIQRETTAGLRLDDTAASLERRGGSTGANASTTWQSLQHEILDRLVQLKKLTALGVTGGLTDSLEELNRKVSRYNELVPSPELRKPKLTRDNFIDELGKWG